MNTYKIVISLLVLTAVVGFLAFTAVHQAKANAPKIIQCTWGQIKSGTMPPDSSGTGCNPPGDDSPNPPGHPDRNTNGNSNGNGNGNTNG